MDKILDRNQLEGIDLSSVGGMPDAPPTDAPAAKPSLVKLSPEYVAALEQHLVAQQREMEEMKALVLAIGQVQGVPAQQPMLSHQFSELGRGFFEVVKFGIPWIAGATLLLFAIKSAGSSNQATVQMAQANSALAMAAMKQKKPVQVTCILALSCPQVPTESELQPVVLTVSAPANFRYDPAGKTRGVFRPGDPIEDSGDRVDRAGIQWAKVKDQNGRTGWVAASYIVSQ